MDGTASQHKLTATRSEQSIASASKLEPGHGNCYQQSESNDITRLSKNLA
jgi:hypothetical protein